MTKPLDQLTPADFEALVGQRFTVVQNEGDLGLELVNVRALPPHGRRTEPFALTFHGPRQPTLSQRIHTLAHADLGALVVFLVPVQGGVDGVDYEAIFN
jgi:hypothetical protein